jgi:hypothetical protein
VRAREEQIFTNPDALAGIELREQEQLQLMTELSGYYAEQPFSRGMTPDLRYYLDNEMFGYGDAIALYAMLRHFRPRRFVEVGSGFTSALALDTNDLFLDGQLSCTFIEPYNERLRGLLRGSDSAKHVVVEQPVQSVDGAVFDSLESGDFLFIDSTHVSKIGSDVNTLFFDVLPRLPPGVIVHLHDIFYPFEYPKDWVYEGRAWNEAYMLRAFLMNNNSFRILLWNSYLGSKHRDRVGQLMPLWGEAPGASIWLERVG